MAGHREILRAIAGALDDELFAIGMMMADSICYGGRLDEEKRHKRSLEKIKALLPESLLAEFALEKRRAKAARLRAEADALLAGDATSDQTRTN